MKIFDLTGPSHPVPLIIAHRGASAVAPENTLAAFRRAMEFGADGIEFDVRLAADGIPVVIHDPSLRRTAGRRGKVAAYSSEELSHIDVGSWFARPGKNGAKAEFAEERIVTLASALEFLKSFRGEIYVELKCKGDDLYPLARAAAAAIERADLAGTLIVKSFRLPVVTFFRENLPKVRTAALFAPKIMTILRKDKHLVRLAEEIGAHELSIHYSLATEKLMKKAAKAELPVNIWTADHGRLLKRAARLGVKAVITNDPAKLLKKREEFLGVTELKTAVTSA